MHKDSDLIQDQLAVLNKSRDFKCPCGKTYLSYAALFTHIKQKHQGKAPGKISKPPTLHEKRGRPPVKSKNQKKDIEKITTDPNQEVELEPSFAAETLQEKFQRERMAQEAIRQTVKLLQEMPKQEVNKTHLNQIDAFSELNVYFNTRGQFSLYIHGNISLADGFSEYAKKVSQQVEWKTFQPFYLAFMLFVQFIIDSQNNKRVICEANMDIFCEYVNEFIQGNLLQMAQYYQLEYLWIVQPANTIRLFHNFFNWAMLMRYVSYKITLLPKNQQSKKTHY